MKKIKVVNIGISDINKQKIKNDLIPPSLLFFMLVIEVNIKISKIL